MKRYPGLDLLRAIAILWVLLFHGMTEGLGSAFPLVGQLGWMGVDLFFVLSGTLIGSQLLKTYASGRTPSVGLFYMRRAFRIIPVYFVVLALYFCIPVFREAKGIQPFWQFLTFTENLLIDYPHNPAFSHAWSLCVEEHFYLLFPLLAWALMRRPSMRKMVAVCVLIVTAGMFLRGYVWLHHVGIAGARPGAYVELIYYPTYMRLDGLLAGVGLAAIRCFRPKLWQRAMDNPYRLLVLGLFSLTLAIWVARGRVGFSASVFGFPFLSASLAMIVAACVSGKNLLGRVHVPGAETIATVTFSLYLSHKMTWHVIRIFCPGLVSGGGLQAFCVYAGGAFLVGAVLYLIVERPFLLLRDRIEVRQKSGFL
jgi:peptidoglycan/LPS O-acetylase OafA/YrhL